MINNIDISKSFYMLGTSRETCFGCKYCRATDTQENQVSYNMMPVGVNRNFTTIPVAVNLYYGDPLLNLESTYQYLFDLLMSGHKGPVVLVTKGDINIPWLKDHTFSDLDLHIALSTFGVEHEYDKHSHKQFIKNLNVIIPHKKSIEFRPICNGINDSSEIIDNIFELAFIYDLAIGYSGLQGKPETIEYWKKNDIDLIPYPGFEFGHKKSISKEVQEQFDELSLKWNVPIFRKTSCLISYVHKLERDYNAHYYRPSEMNCDKCVMKAKCFKFKSELGTDPSKIKHLIPFNFEIEYKDKHECILKKKNICEYPTPDCSNIKGNIIKINEKLTTADVRVIKWLTGYTVDADFEESQFLNNKWNV